MHFILLPPRAFKSLWMSLKHLNSHCHRLKQVHPGVHYDYNYVRVSLPEVRNFKRYIKIRSQR